MSVVDCVRCTAFKADGGRCTRRTCKYQGMCWQHSQSQRGLKLTQSNIPGAGQGLFATRNFDVGDTVAVMATRRHKMTRQQYDNTEHPQLYGQQFGRHVWDARSTQSGMGRYANDCRTANRNAGHCVHNNTKPALNASTGRITLKARRRIRRGDEIFQGYGRAYHV